MPDTFTAASLSRTSRCDNTTLEVEVLDASGQLSKIRVTAEIAASLARALQDFADRCSESADGTMTKVPQTYSVGSGRFEPVVLVRFEDDAPYALSAAEAIELGEALIDEAESIGAMPARTIQ